MRTTWNGSLSFGLVSIPVGLAPATKPAARQSDVSFRLLHRECLTPIRQKRWCPKHDREVGPDELVKGWEVAKGQYVVVVPDRQLTVVHLGKTDHEQRPTLVAALGELIETFPVTGASAIAGVAS